MGVVNPYVIAKSAKSIVSRVEINFNRLAGRQLVPLQTKILNIETSSLCNLKCVFCAYVKKTAPKVSMTDAFFQSCIEQATTMGYTQFELTPCTGDVFMDRHVFNKLQFLDDQPAAEAYHFFTNFTILKRKDVDRLIRLKKLKNLTISIYGHDLASFIAITKSTEKIYNRLRGNLEALLERMDEKKFNLSFVVRTTKDAPRRPTSDVMKLLERFRQRGVHIRGSRVYNNWGGAITQADVKGLAIDVSGTETVYKRGACTLLFSDYQVMATGVVNGCAARDANASLQIGNLHTAPLHKILSPDNPVYMRLIEEQERGEFRSVCKSCDYYKSIYHMRRKFRKDGTQFQTIEQYKEWLRTMGRRATGAPVKKPAAKAPSLAPPSRTEKDGVEVPAGA